MGKYGPGQPADFTGPRVTRSVSESLERLDTEYIDLILIHDIEYVDDLKEVPAPDTSPDCCALVLLPTQMIASHRSVLDIRFKDASSSVRIQLILK